MVTQKKLKQKKARIQTDAGKSTVAVLTPEKPSRFNERWIVLALLAVLSIIVFRRYLSFEQTYLFTDIGSDSVNAFYPQVVHLLDLLHSEGLPKWSFSQGMGQNIFAFGTGDIFMPVFYLFGRDNVGFALAYVEVLKILLAGLVFHAYLRMLGLTSFASLAGALLFGFSGYMILGGGWYAFSYEALCCALILLGFESYFKKGVWWILPIPFAILGAFQPFDIYLYGLLLIVYSTLRFLEDRKWSFAGYFKFLFGVGLPALLGVALCSVFLFENIQQLLESPRVGGDSSYVNKLSAEPIFALASPPERSSIVLRLFSSDMQGTGKTFGGWQNYLEAPILYCGLLTLLVAPQFIVSLRGKKLKIHLALAAVCFLALMFPYFRYMFYGFNGNYYRAFGFFVSLMVLYFGVRGLSHIDRTSNVNLVALGVSIATCLALLYLPAYARVDVPLRGIVTLFLIAYAVMLALAMGTRKGFVQKLLLAAMCIELAFLSNITVNERLVVSAAELSNRVGFNDYTIDAVRKVQSSDADFYRINKDYSSGPAMHTSLNDAKIQRYYGSASYYSFNQKHYIEFLQGVDVIPRNNETATRWAVGTRSRPFIETVTNVKYKLTKNTQADALGPIYQHVADFHDVHLFKNPDSLPLGFTYDSYVTASDFAKLPPDTKDKALMRSAVIQDQDAELFKDFTRLDPNSIEAAYTLEHFKRDTAARRKNAMAISRHSQSRIEGTVDLDAKKLIFFAIPYDQGWSLVVDGQTVPLLMTNIGFMGVIMDAGHHSVELSFTPRRLKLGAAASLLSLLVYGFFIYRLPLLRQPDIEHV